MNETITGRVTSPPIRNDKRVELFLSTDGVNEIWCLGEISFEIPFPLKTGDVVSFTGRSVKDSGSGQLANFVFDGIARSEGSFATLPCGGIKESNRR